MTESPRIIKIATLAIIKDRKILMTREDDSGDAYYLPGGTIEPGENDIDCLRREIVEELGVGIVQETARFLREFEADAHGKVNTLVNMKLYVAELLGEPVASSEVLEIRYFDSSIPKKHQAPIAKQIFDWLKENDFVD